jgi:hypothetical protein
VRELQLEWIGMDWESGRGGGGGGEKLGHSSGHSLQVAERRSGRTRLGSWSGGDEESTSER